MFASVMSRPRFSLALAHSLLCACIAAGCASPPPLADAAPGTVTLTVEVRDVQPQQGIVRCALYADPATYLKPGGMLTGSGAAAGAGTTMEFTFEVQTGVPLAVSVFQDVNSNEKLDRGSMGIPVEPWGFSGDQQSIGPPSWNAAALTPTVDNHRTVIVLRAGLRRTP